MTTLPSLPPTRRSAWLGALLLTLAALPTIAPAQTRAQPKLPTVNLAAGMYNIVAELAVSPQEQMTGMMFRTEMAPHEGMLFVGDGDERRCFWMRNTYLPLTAAFVAADGTIVNLADMQPRSDDSHCSAGPVRFVLEMNQGWFAKRGIKAGFKLRGTPFKP
jgi:uncharacterized membrane protein (UPF0127 family)